MLSFDLEGNTVKFSSNELYTDWKVFHAVEAAQQKNREEVKALKETIEELTHNLEVIMCNENIPRQASA